MPLCDDDASTRGCESVRRLTGQRSRMLSGRSTCPFMAIECVPARTSPILSLVSAASGSGPCGGVAGGDSTTVGSRSVIVFELPSRSRGAAGCVMMGSVPNKVGLRSLCAVWSRVSTSLTTLEVDAPQPMLSSVCQSVVRGAVSRRRSTSAPSRAWNACRWRNLRPPLTHACVDAQGIITHSDERHPGFLK